MKTSSFVSMICLLAPLTSHATDAQFLVDDAFINGPGLCQMDTWLSRHDTNFLTARPVCGIREGWEVSLPVGYDLSNSQFTTATVMAKTRLARSRSFGDIALSLSADYNAQQNEFSEAALNVPWSADVGGNMTWHLNGGLSYLRDTHNWYATWGAASTYAYNENMDLMIEAAGFGSESPAVSVGGRYKFGQRNNLDFSLGRDFERQSNFVTLGLTLPFSL